MQNQDNGVIRNRTFKKAMLNILEIEAKIWRFLKRLENTYFKGIKYKLQKWKMQKPKLTQLIGLKASSTAVKEEMSELKKGKNNFRIKYEGVKVTWNENSGEFSKTADKYQATKWKNLKNLRIN